MFTHALLMKTINVHIYSICNSSFLKQKSNFYLGIFGNDKPNTMMKDQIRISVHSKVIYYKIRTEQSMNIK